MVESTTIIRCLNTKCDRPLRVPTNLGLLKITCPHCKTQFHWGSISTRELDFRCATSGKKFKVVFAKPYHHHKYRIIRILSESIVEDLTTVSQNNRFREEIQQPFNVDEFDLSGWYCFHCNYTSEPLFIQCGSCKEFVCGAKVIHINKNISTFECYPECSGSGEIKGKISSYLGKAESINKSKNLSSVQISNSNKIEQRKITK